MENLVDEADTLEDCLSLLRGEGVLPYSRSKSWTKQLRAAFDVETTGLSYTDDRIVQASLVLVSKDDKAIFALDWIIDPGMEIPQEVVDVHGVTNEMVKEEGVPLEQGVPEIVHNLNLLFEEGIPVVAFNAAFDMTFVKANAAVCGVEDFTPCPVIDPYVMNKFVQRYRKGKRNLGVLCQDYNIPTENMHNASYDAYCAAKYGWCLAREYFQLDLPAEKLHEKQILWSRAQGHSLRDYFVSIGNYDPVDIGWPLRDGF